MEDWNMVVNHVFLSLASIISHRTFWLPIVSVASSLWTFLRHSLAMQKEECISWSYPSPSDVWFPRIYFRCHVVHFPVQRLVTPLNMSGDGNVALRPPVTSGPSHNTERNELFLLQTVERISSNSLLCLICSLMPKQKMGPGSVCHLPVYSGNR